ENASAIEIVGRLVPVLLQTVDQILEADGDRTPLVVLHLDRRTIEAEELPHLLRGDRERPLVELSLELLRRRGDRQQDQRVVRYAAGKGAPGGDDRRAAGAREPGRGPAVSSATRRAARPTGTTCRRGPRTTITGGRHQPVLPRLRRLRIHVAL